MYQEITITKYLDFVLDRLTGPHSFAQPTIHHIHPAKQIKHQNTLEMITPKFQLRIAIIGIAIAIILVTIVDGKQNVAGPAKPPVKKTHKMQSAPTKSAFKGAPSTTSAPAAYKNHRPISNNKPIPHVAILIAFGLLMLIVALLSVIMLGLSIQFAIFVIQLFRVIVNIFRWLIRLFRACRHIWSA